MSLNIYNFNNYDGIARRFGDNGKRNNNELLLYLKGHCNAELAICSKVKEKNCIGYYLYNFLCDKEHLKNCKNDDFNWFGDICEITLYIKKITPFLSLLIQYAREQGIRIILEDRESDNEEA